MRSEAMNLRAIEPPGGSFTPMSSVHPFRSIPFASAWRAGFGAIAIRTGLGVMAVAIAAQVRAEPAPDHPAAAVEVVPAPFDGALRNPLMGLTGRELTVHPWGTLTHHYIGWNELEVRESDGLDRIMAFCDAAWRGLPEQNVKVIPRVYLQYPGRPDAWPEGLAAGDFSSAEFARRLRLFVAKLGRAWDADPRVAFIELGLFGQWGEHHSPEPSEEIQRVAGAAFARAFPHKLVSVRRAWETFYGHDFGEYWDSFAHWDEMASNGREIAACNRATGLWKRNYVGGEVAYDWGRWRIQPGESPTVSLADPVHLAYVLNTVHWLQCTQLRWIGDYDRADVRAVAGAARLQRALGYRFVLDSVRFAGVVREGGRLRVDVVVTNTGSAPFYYRWPLEVSLLDERDHRVLWRDVFSQADPREWQPGRSTISPEWTTPGADEPARAIWPDHEIAASSEPPEPHVVSGEFRPDLPAGRYVLALALLDPAGMRPAVRFATTQYWQGGRHPVGLVGFGGKAGGPLPANLHFDDPNLDQTLRYDPGEPTHTPITDRAEDRAPAGHSWPAQTRNPPQET